MVTQLETAFPRVTVFKYFTHFGWLEGTVLDRVGHERLPFVASQKHLEKQALCLLPRQLSRWVHGVDADVLI